MKPRNTMFARDLRRKYQNALPGVSTPRKGGDIYESKLATPLWTLFLIDYSYSMDCEDYPPSRYLAAAYAVREYISQRMVISTLDWASAILFGSSPQVICQNTTMEKATQDIVDPILRLSPDGSTNMKGGINKAGSLFKSSSLQSKCERRLLILSDGHADSSPIRVAEKLKDRGVIIYAIGIGDCPSSVDEKTLRKVASTVDGDNKYRFIGDSNELITHFKNIATGIVKAR